jgi:hypothetical protein
MQAYITEISLEARCPRATFGRLAFGGATRRS